MNYSRGYNEYTYDEGVQDSDEITNGLFYESHISMRPPRQNSSDLSDSVFTSHGRKSKKTSPGSALGGFQNRSSTAETSPSSTVQTTPQSEPPTIQRPPEKKLPEKKPAAEGKRSKASSMSNPAFRPAKSISLSSGTVLSSRPHVKTDYMAMLRMPNYLPASLDIDDTPLTQNTPLTHMPYVQKTHITHNSGVVNFNTPTFDPQKPTTNEVQELRELINHRSWAGESLKEVQKRASAENSKAAHPPMKGNPAKWTCHDVSQWFTDAGYPELAKTFLDQAVDGEAIMMLKRKDLISLNEEINVFGVKLLLGPALKVHAMIEDLKKASRRMSK
ncbi:SAM domain (Sterile alpha motif) domain-containing protein [Ditylenchus destructor]|nr:SAM domain (Sterile alpha motif) domain-containing protein [Ditylenchus destructor]